VVWVMPHGRGSFVKPARCRGLERSGGPEENSLIDCGLRLAAGIRRDGAASCFGAWSQAYYGHIHGSAAAGVEVCLGERLEGWGRSAVGGMGGRGGGRLRHL